MFVSESHLNISHFKKEISSDCPIYLDFVFQKLPFVGPLSTGMSSSELKKIEVLG